MPNLLVGGFGSFFLNRLCLFKNAAHILDDEREIEAYLRSLDLSDHGVPLNHFRFANSKSEAGVQLSDPSVGLLGKLFTYINRTPWTEIESDLRGLNAQQRANLSRLAGLLDRSTDTSPAFAQYLISNEDRRRAALVLQDDVLRSPI